MRQPLDRPSVSPGNRRNTGPAEQPSPSRERSHGSIFAFEAYTALTEGLHETRFRLSGFPVNELRILGDIDLRDTDGNRVDSIVAQPKLFALLAYVTLAIPGGAQQRDLLISVFWPELAESNARNALNQSLHRLRQALDPHAVVSHGTNEVGIDHSRLSCDALDFVEAIDAGELETALGLYRGNLLTGLFVPGSPDFERWLDGERAKLRRMAFEAAITLGREAETAEDLASAARWDRRAMNIIPERGTAVRQLMAVLARAGNPAEAVLEFDRFAARLEEDYALQPSDETRAVVESIRSSLSVEVDTRGGLGASNVLAGMTATSPADRFQTAGEMARALETPETVGRVRRRGRQPWHLAVGGVALLTVGAGIWAVATRGGPESEPTDTAIPLDSTKIAVLPFQVIGADSMSPTRLLAQSIGKIFEISVTGEFGLRFAHHGSVVEEWRRAGGTPDTELSEAAQLELGRSLGVGALVRGTMIVEGDSVIVFAASMLDVASGEPRVTRVRAEGPLDRRLELVDQLIVELLARDRGVSTESVQRLKQFDPEAVEAFLASDYEAALAADSSLIDAALWKFVDGEGDLVALRYAWEHQDQLTERGRAYLQVIAAGRYGSIRTMAQQIAAYETLTRRWPEWNQMWRELGGRLADQGARASVPDWRRRAREAFERIDPPSTYDLWHLTELAFMDQDTARARELVDRYLAAPGGWFTQRKPAYRWRLAILEGDTAAATRALAATPDSIWVPGFALTDGTGIADADRVMAARGSIWWPDRWAWARGRESEWRNAWKVSASDPDLEYMDLATIPVYRALLLGPSEDATANEATQTLERIASGRDGEPLSPNNRTLAQCWITLWRLEHGDTTGARETLRHLAEPERSHRFAGWAGLIDVLLTRVEGGDVHTSLLRADSVVQGWPLGGGGYNSVNIHNLLLARMLAEYGEPERALAAIRRRSYFAGFVMYNLNIPEYIREEARLAATVGDTAGAVEAYRHYFALRDVRPKHPTWAAQWDSMRVEFGALTEIDTP